MPFHGPRAPLLRWLRSQSIALVRRFQTGSRLQRTKDSSSVDFACFPSVPDVNPSRESIQVPYLPDLYKVPVPSLSHEPEVIEPVFRAEISTVAMESTHAHPPSAMSDVVDNAAIILDPYELTTQVDQAARKMGEKVVTDDREAKGMLKQIWTGLVDDVLGTSSLKPT